MTTVFDVATALLDRAGGPLQSLKLQKLCFYVFGWHAHLTAEPLFEESFYAMEKGPVVGELLSAHAGRKHVTKAMLATQLTEREEERAQALGPYASAVVDSVWKTYGHLSGWELVQLTHQEGVWTDAWESRRPGSRRGELHQTDMIAYFLARAPRSGEDLDLPWPIVSYISSDDLARVDAQTGAHDAFTEALRSLVAS